MAISIEISTPQGFTVGDAYVRIARFIGTKLYIQVQVEIYKDLQARLDDKQTIERMNIDLPLPNGATLEEMYAALKLLPEFTNAVDC